MFLDDPFSERMETYLRSAKPDLHLSDFAAAEFASSLSLKIRIGQVTKIEASDALLDFDRWRSAVPGHVDTQSRDVQAAEAMLRRFDLILRTPDAVHIAVALRIGCELITFDGRMADAARALGLPVAAA